MHRFAGNWVFFTAILVVFFMLSYVVPMFQDIFKQIPFLTKMIIRLSDLVKSYGFLFVLLMLSALFAGRLLRKNENYTKAIHYLALRIPFLGPFISKVYLAQFTQAVALLTASKVPILNSIQMVKIMIGFVPLKEALENVEKNILLGHSLSISLKGNRMFDSRIISLVKVAEETNQTEYVFKQLNEQYNQEVILQSKVMSIVLEPLIIVFVGVLVAMYLPMF
ncbi:type II secretion system F family protein [Flavobacterium supellecticarium]|uniref:type II secretion system F family protein n=1 Tax=Flavobacterium supellecticarium TaxID=2565924 RepID=UPI001E48E430|nr:type II secretion system F family protein [Flavobacterium supellecticarium]